MREHWYCFLISSLKVSQTHRSDYFAQIWTNENKTMIRSHFQLSCGQMGVDSAREREVAWCGKWGPDFVTDGNSKFILLPDNLKNMYK